jgi:hypothetical protein
MSVSILAAVLLLASTVHAANHCVCANDPYGGPNHICDYGCISAPCSICSMMCSADGGYMSTCTGGCSGGGGICQKSTGGKVYDKYQTVSNSTDQVGAGCSLCNTQWLCTASDCTQGYPLLAGQCYAANVQINSRNDQSIRITQGSSCYIQSFTDAACQNANYGPPDGDISSACCTCFQINILMNFKINGNLIAAHAWADPPATAMETLPTDSVVKLGPPQEHKMNPSIDHM